MPITNQSERKYQFLYELGSGNYYVRRRSDGKKFICERYLGDVQPIVDALNAVEGVPGVTQLVDVITEYRTPAYEPPANYEFAGSVLDVPLYTDVFITTLPNAKSPTSVIADDTPFSLVVYVLKQILYALINIKNRGVVYLPLHWQNVVVDATNYKTLMFGVCGAEFGSDPSRLPALFGRFVESLMVACNLSDIPSAIIRLTNAAFAATTLEELVPPSFPGEGRHLTW